MCHPCKTLGREAVGEGCLFVFDVGVVGVG